MKERNLYPTMILKGSYWKLVPLREMPFQRLNELWNKIPHPASSFYQLTAHTGLQETFAI